MKNQLLASQAKHANYDIIEDHSWQVRVNMTLAELSKKLLSLSEIDEIPALILKHAKSLTGSLYGRTGYVDWETDRIVNHTLIGSNEGPVVRSSTPVREFEGFWRDVINNKMPVLTNCLEKDPRRTFMPDNHYPIKRFVAAPAILDGVLVGHVALANSETDYTAKELDVLQRLADLHAIAIQRKQAEQALAKSEKHYDLILNGVTEIVLLYEVEDDLNLRVVKANDTAVKMIGLKKNDLIGRSMQEVVSEFGFDKPRNLYETAIRNKESMAGEIDLGQHGFFETSCIPILDDNDKCSHVVVTARDITEKKKAEEQIVFQATLLEQVRNAVVAADLCGKIVYWNKSAAELFQLDPREVMWKHINDISMFKQELVELKNSINQAIYEKGYWEAEVEVRRNDGSIIPCHKVISIIKNAQDNPIGYVAVSTDISERRKFESDIARLDRLNLIGQMAAGIGHEVRNPMTAVRGFLQLLLSRDKYNEDKEFFNLMIGELDRANSIISEFLSLAKDKKVVLRMQNVNNIIGNVIPLLNADALIYDKHISTELNDIPEILMDEKEISQLIINLVRNGLEAMKNGGCLTLRTFQDDDEIVLSVTDQGPGIPQPILEKLGTPFVTTKDGGTGLGLAICYSIANRHNAIIYPETGPSGTTFYVRFRR